METVEAAAPVPVKPTVWGLPLALSLMLSVPVMVPEDWGAKNTLMVQDELALRLAPQLFVGGKLALPVPMLVMVTGTVPVLVSVTGCELLSLPCAWLAKVRLGGETETAGTAAVPVKVTVCEPALSTMLRLPLVVPLAVGVNVTVIVQAPPAPMLVPQLLFWEKPALVVKLVKVTEAVPE